MAAMKKIMQFLSRFEVEGELHPLVQFIVVLIACALAVYFGWNMF